MKTKGQTNVVSKPKTWWKKHRITVLECTAMTAVMLALCFISVECPLAINTNITQHGGVRVTGLDKVIGLATTVVIALGVVVAIFGGITLGIGFREDQSEQQTRGIRTIIAGVIMASVTAIIKWFSIS